MTTDLPATLRRLIPAARWEVVAQQSSKRDRRLCTHLLGPSAEVCRWRRETRDRAVVEGVHYTVRRIEQPAPAAEKEAEA